MARNPLLPGFNLPTNQSRNFHLNQYFNLTNGYHTSRINLNELLELEVGPCGRDKELLQGNYRFETYPSHQTSTVSAFIPRYVINDGKCLSFHGYFKQEAAMYGLENLIYRKINLIYYLEDDTMTIVELPVPNSGYVQGRLVRRGRVPKRNSSGYWHWKDLNTGRDIKIYDIVYHLSRCDKFTRGYLQSQGIDVNQDEEIPCNTAKDDIQRRYRLNDEESAPWQDKLHKFLQYDKKVLRFYAVHYENEEEYDEEKFYKIYYYLVDDTVEIREQVYGVRQNEPFRRLLSRARLPKNQTNHHEHSVSIPYLESPIQYYKLIDFVIGSHIYVLKKKFLIYDCDEFTRRYYKQCLKLEQPVAIEIPKKQAKPTKHSIPPHTGIGQPEDTLQSCLSIVPRPPRKNIIHYVENTNKFLRYSTKLDSTESDQDREFILQYSLANGKISIYEIGKPNSGFSKGYFLKSVLVPKPSLNLHQDMPTYYSPTDFYIGSIIDIFGHKFIITGADLAVYQYMQNESSKFGDEIKNNIKSYLEREGILIEDSKNDEST